MQRDAGAPDTGHDAETDRERDAGLKPDDATASAHDAAPASVGDAGEFASCAALDVQASARNVPVDIVWIIDSSGSMNNERAAIQRELNQFAARFADASIDVRVVVMTDARDFEVPAPLGVDRTRFLLVDRNVGSDDALSFFVEHFDDYAAFLRPEAKLELIAVTDDESKLAASAFVSGMRAKVGKDFRLHALASERVNDRPCEGAHAPGDEYYAAAAQTSGLTFSVCQLDGMALFDALANTLTEGTPLPCELTLPKPPDGSELDPNLINVVYDQADAGARTTVPRLSDGNKCGAGWFYDDPQQPRVITLCPNFCQGAGTGGLHIVFGCQTITLL